MTLNRGGRQQCSSCMRTSSIVSDPIVYQSYCVSVPFCTCCTVSDPIVHQSFCVSVPLYICSIVSGPIVSRVSQSRCMNQSRCVPVPLCPSPVVSRLCTSPVVYQSRCVPCPLCPSPVVYQVHFVPVVYQVHFVPVTGLGSRCRPGFRFRVTQETGTE